MNLILFSIIELLEYIVDNGIGPYFEWKDELKLVSSWKRRSCYISSDASSNSSYRHILDFWNAGSELYDFTIIFPVRFLAALTAIVLFALVRVIGGTTAGLFSALLYSISLPIIIRATMGWFKSEPLGLFYGILGIYLFLSGIKSENKKIAALKLIGGGIILAFGLTSWGGIQFFVMPLGAFILALPFLRKDLGFIVWSVPLFVFSFFLTLSMFERPGYVFHLWYWRIHINSAYRIFGCMCVCAKTE